MGTETLIPSVDPMPLPAPFWLFKGLLVLTFVLHILAMNAMFGGGLIAAVTRIFRGKNENNARLFRDIAPKIPSLLAATVTLGIAPLLFVQVLFGQFFYTSSAILAWPWFLVIVLLVLAYYGFYIVSFRKDSPSRGPVLTMLFGVCLIASIGFIYVNNFTLMNTPGSWHAKYFQDPSGWNLNWSEQTLIPRFTHLLVGSVAVGSFLVILTGLFRWEKEREYARFLIVRGGNWFVYATMAQFAVGTWFLVTLPHDEMMLFLGGNVAATILFLIAILGGLAAISITSNAIRSEDPRRQVSIAMGITVVVVAIMAVMRDLLRSSYLSPYFSAGAQATDTQWDVLVFFLALFVIGVLVWVKMMRIYFRPGRG
jgi:hypothetical protein